MIAKVLYRLAAVLSIIWMSTWVFSILAYPEKTVVRVTVGKRVITMRVPAGAAETDIKEVAKNAVAEKMPHQGGSLLELPDPGPVGEIQWIEPSILERLSRLTELRPALIVLGPPIALFVFVALGVWVFTPLRGLFRS